MTSKKRDREPIEEHAFRPAVLHESRCRSCGHGVDRENADGSFVHLQAREAHAALLNRVKTSPATEEFARQENARLAREHAAERAAGKVDVPGFEQTFEAPINAQAFQPNELKQEFTGERMKVGLTYRAVLAGGKFEDRVVTLEVPMELWPELSAHATDVPDWTLQAFLDRACELIAEERAAGQRGVLEISAAHRADAAAFRQQVADVALKHAIAHDWCDEVLETLGELGILVDQARVVAHVVMPHTFEIKLPYSEMSKYRLDPAGWVESKIENLPFVHPDLYRHAGAAGLGWSAPQSGRVEDAELAPAVIRWAGDYE